MEIRKNQLGSVLARRHKRKLPGESASNRVRIWRSREKKISGEQRESIRKYFRVGVVMERLEPQGPGITTERTDKEMGIC